MVLLSELVGPQGTVHAFEANPERLPDLGLTARAAGNVVVHPFGLSDGDHRATLFVPRDETTASLRDWTEGRVEGAARQTPCELKALDALVARGVVPAPDFIKCDIEGGERDMFAGAERTLNQTRAPIILYEAHLQSAAAFGCTLSAATDFLRGLPAPEYAIALVQPGGRLVWIDGFDPAHDHFNLVAIPRARRDRLDPPSPA
jgi:FkbM family methyltransferase